MWCVGCFRERTWCRGREGVGPTCGKVAAAVANSEVIWYALQLTRDVLGVMWVVVGVCGVRHTHRWVNEAWICVGRLMGVVGWL